MTFTIAAESAAKKLAQSLERLQRRAATRDLWLSKNNLRGLAQVLLELAEDVGDETGLWAAYERHNVELFGAALPLTPGSDLSTRIRHLLWILYPVLIPDVHLSPTDAHLERLAQCATEFVRQVGLPTGPARARRRLAGPNDRAEDVKQKLVWLGTHSFLFRLMQARYMADRAEPGREIDTWDDFVCQECTTWSGLGVIDVLAAMLELEAADRDTLKTWYLRHAAAYRVLAVASKSLRLENVVNGREYGVRYETDLRVEVGQVIFGSLVPWRGDWYWSGAQRVFEHVTEDAVATIRRETMARQSQIVCRYWPEHEARVRERAAAIHASSLAFHGDDLVVYADGLSLAAGFQRELRAQWEAKPAAQRDAAREKHGLWDDRPDLRLPDNLVQHGDGLGVFLNPEDGQEIMLHFSTLISGLRRAGGATTADESEAIRGFVLSDSVSPQFVRRVVRDHGAGSIRAAFLLDADAPSYWLEYLLRKHKGHFYRRRFPTLSLMD